MNYEIDTQSLSRVDALRIINEDSKNLKEVKIATASWTPLEDAKFGKNNLIRFLKKELNLNENSWVDDISTIHGAIFPNTPKQDGTLPPDIKPEMIIWSEDYQNPFGIFPIDRRCFLETCIQDLL